MALEKSYCTHFLEQLKKEFCSVLHLPKQFDNCHIVQPLHETKSICGEGEI